MDWIKLLFRKDRELYLSLYEILGFYPNNIEYYKTAMLHSSVAKKNQKGKPINNERLEFLGDAVLNAVVGHIVYDHFPGKREGFLTNTRSKLVQRDMLNKLAKEMGIARLIISHGQNLSHNSYIEGNAFEALVGAIYLDKGYKACMKFVKKRILDEVVNLDKVAYKVVNFKSRLIEWCQKNRVTIEFRLLKQERDANGNPFFKYQVFIEDIEGGIAMGFSKKESQQQAAKLTLEMLRKHPQLIDEIMAIKSDRTKMEENLLMSLPEEDAQEDFFIEKKKHHRASKDTNKDKDNSLPTQETIASKVNKAVAEKSNTNDKGIATRHTLDEDDVANQERESIIAAAEEEAFKDLN